MYYHSPYCSDVVMAIVKHDKWKDAMRNTSDSLSRYKKTTPMRRLIKKMPGVRPIINNESKVSPYHLVCINLSQ